MDKINRVFVGLAICFFAFIVISIVLSNKAYDEQCIQAGYEKYKFIERMEYCEDSDGNLYYIDMDCNDIFTWRDCSLREISVGNVRVVQNA